MLSEQRDAASAIGVFAPEIRAGEPHRAVANATNLEVAAEGDRPSQHVPNLPHHETSCQIDPSTDR
jgi:hypothetical protein